MLSDIQAHGPRDHTMYISMLRCQLSIIELTCQSILVNVCGPGWGGGGLGQLEQGMMDPVQHAEVRDRTDLYKGIGISLNDPFENFRKSKSHGFVTRMREKAEVASGASGAGTGATADDDT